jgi:hypothetical protein
VYNKYFTAAVLDEELRFFKYFIFFITIKILIRHYTLLIKKSQHLTKFQNACRFDKKFDKQLLPTFYVTKISYLFTTKLVKQIINKFTFKI